MHYIRIWLGITGVPALSPLLKGQSDGRIKPCYTTLEGKNPADSCVNTEDTKALEFLLEKYRSFHSLCLLLSALLSGMLLTLHNQVNLGSLGMMLCLH